MKLYDILNEDPQAQAMAANRSFETLVSYAKQLSAHKGKLGAFIMIILEELQVLGDKQAIEAFRKEIEPVYGRYIAKAPKPERVQSKRSNKSKVPVYFNTRQKARTFARGGGEFRDMGTDKPIGKRWAVLVNPQDRRIKK